MYASRPESARTAKQERLKDNYNLPKLHNCLVPFRELPAKYIGDDVFKRKRAKPA